MSVSIKNLSSQIHGAFDNAIFSGRIQRMIINIKTGEFWVEEAPMDYNGRPPLVDEAKNTLMESNKKNYLDMLDEKQKNDSNRQSPYSSDDNPIYYSIRSIPVVQKKVLLPVKWNEVSDSIISKQSLSGNVVFAKFMSGLSTSVYEYSVVAQSSNPKDTKYGYIYFLPDGTATPTSIQLGSKNSVNAVSENGPQYTLNLNTLTGQLNLLEGFQDANFKLPKK